MWVLLPGAQPVSNATPQSWNWAVLYGRARGEGLVYDIDLILRCGYLVTPQSIHTPYYGKYCMENRFSDLATVFI